MGIPATGIHFGPDTDDPTNGYYHLTSDGTADCAATIQAVIDNSTLCPSPTTYPTSGVGAGGLAGVGQTFIFDGRGKYQLRSKLTFGNKSIRIEGNGCVFDRWSSMSGYTLMEFSGGGYGSPHVHNVELDRFLCNGGQIKFKSGHKPRITMADVGVSSCPAGTWGFEFGHQVYWLKMARCSARQCGGGIKSPRTSSDLCLIEDFDSAWMMDLPDIQANSSGCRIVRGDLEARDANYTGVPAIDILPTTSVSTTGSMANGSAVITSMGTTTGIAVDDLISVAGAGAAGVTLYGVVVSVDSATQITISTTCANGTGVSGAAVNMIASASFVTVDGAHFGGEATASGGPPDFCIRVGGASVNSTVRTRIIIKNCDAVVNQGTGTPASHPTLGPTALSSNGFLLLNSPLQDCLLLDNDMTQGNAASGINKGFHSYAVQSPYADSSYALNNHSNRYRGNGLSKLSQYELFSPTAILGWTQL